MISKPKGTYDLLGKDAKIYNYIEDEIKQFMACYNYDFIRTPVFEDKQLFHRGMGDTSDVVTKETYDFKDRGDREITLRPEGTAGVVRSLIENKLYGNRNDAIKYYYLEAMYRYERPQAGRFREFTQFGVEVFNSGEVEMDAEVISMGYNLIKTLGLEDIEVSLNTLGDMTSRKNYTEALVKYLTPQINDLCPDCQRRLESNPLRILDCKVDKENPILKNVPKISAYLSEDSKKRFQKLKNYLTILDIDYVVDENLVRGLDYYDDFVWEYKMETTSLALGGGGRYNNLVRDLGGPDMKAVGFGLGIDRIIMEINKILPDQEIKKRLDVYIMAVNEEEKMQALRIAQDLRLNDVLTEFNSANLSFKSQFKLADSLNAKFIIILNSEDLQKGLINIKDNATKEEIKVDEAEVVDYILGNI